VKPIPKTGQRFNIILLIPFSKVFEKILCSRMYQHMVQNQILEKEQHGYRSELSTDNASYILIHKILTAMNNKHIVGGIFSNLRNIIVKIRTIQNRGTCKTLIKSYLTERY
jgi:hypothetical protein